MEPADAVESKVMPLQNPTSAGDCNTADTGGSGFGWSTTNRAIPVRMPSAKIEFSNHTI